MMKYPMTLRHLVIGCGEVGGALRSVLRCDGHDINTGVFAEEGATYNVLHVCLNYSGSFHCVVRSYQELFKAGHTIIHSTVPIGTSEALGAHHSPVRGVHPNLQESLTMFTKYIGGPCASELARELKRYGIPTEAVASSRDTEAGKLLDLMQYAASILIEKEIHAFCEENGLDFNLIYTQMNRTYNWGYQQMGRDHFTRPILKHEPGPIGGHCVAQNMVHLNTETAERIMKFTDDRGSKITRQPEAVNNSRTGSP